MSPVNRVFCNRNSQSQRPYGQAIANRSNDPLFQNVAEQKRVGKSVKCVGGPYSFQVVFPNRSQRKKNKPY
jgi:hypothetical protein